MHVEDGHRKGGRFFWPVDRVLHISAGHRQNAISDEESQTEPRAPWANLTHPVPPSKAALRLG